MSYRLLIVDDDAPFRSLLAEAFTIDGYEVHTAQSGEEALKLVAKETYQLFMLDLHMPGMNGLELCKEIRQHSPVAFIFAVTGYASVFDLVKCREAGFDDYFNKPIKLSLLSKAVKDAVERLERWRLA